ncbi:hypothetical protein [Caballeronia sp. LZ034LL]|uniref:hypothetical protein n=1 Tax=Caballeronia sp. LZ034LL TaxID=3038567 RepID=UPI0028600FAE|nr:hypothetical protein [Caballeronia sp. LZ034LL]MDR5839342.1 hypothetical protein [Caballeronia sp. LZ034LL]
MVITLPAQTDTENTDPTNVQFSMGGPLLVIELDNPYRLVTVSYAKLLRGLIAIKDPE